MKRTIGPSLLLVGLVLAGAVSACAAPPAYDAYVAAFAHLFGVDLDGAQTTVVAEVATDATFAVYDGRRLVWSKTAARRFGGFALRGGDRVFSVRLSDPPSLTAIAPDGTAYVTHRVTRGAGFGLSVVDTRRARLIAEAAPFAGIVTSLAVVEGTVYAAAIDPTDSGSRILYRVLPVEQRAAPTEAGAQRKARAANVGAEVIAAAASNGYQWRLSSIAGRLAVFSISGKRENPPDVGVFDPATGHFEERLTASKLPGVRSFIDSGAVHLSSEGVECAFAPVIRSDGGLGVAKLAYEATLPRGRRASLVDIYPVARPISRVIAASDTGFAYVDSLPHVGTDLSVSYYDLRERREKKTVALDALVGAYHETIDSGPSRRGFDSIVQEPDRGR